MSTEDHRGVGEGTVMLDIGGDIGALLITTPAALDGAEIEITPTGSTPHTDPHSWSHDHAHHPDGHHDHEPHLLHVAVHRRPGAGPPRWAAVFPELHAGTYDLRLRPAGPVALSVHVTGGQVTETAWPDRPQ